MDEQKKLEEEFILKMGGTIKTGDRKKNENVLSRLGAGEFFGEMELLRGGKSIANVRAGNKPVEAIVIPRADFVRVIKESPITAEALGRIVQRKLDKQRIADRRSETGR